MLKGEITMADDKNPYADLLADKDTDYVTLKFDDGEEVECAILGVFDCDSNEYIALVPDDGSGDAWLFKYKDISDTEFDIEDITDDAEFEKAAAEFQKLDI